MRTIVPLLALAVAFVSTPAASQSWEAEILAMHNRERASWRVAPLAWDPGLAAGADAWARELARTDRWQHSPSTLRRGQGENLWMGTRGAFPVRAMIGDWLNERRWFRPGLFPAVSTTGRWNDVGHYTQIVASRTTRVGCALQSNRRWTYLVCRYGPAGNVGGKPLP